MILHHFMIPLACVRACAFALAWHKSNILAMWVPFYMRLSNASFRLIVHTLNTEFSNGKIWLCRLESLENTLTHMRKSMATHARTRARIRTHYTHIQDIQITTTKSIAVTQQLELCDETWARECAWVCACKCEWSYGVFCRFHRIYVKLCRQSVAKWNDKINNTVVCDFCFKAQAHRRRHTHTHVVLQPRIFSYIWSQTVDLISLCFTRIEKQKHTTTHAHSNQIVFIASVLAFVSSTSH